MSSDSPPYIYPDAHLEAYKPPAIVEYETGYGDETYWMVRLTDKVFDTFPTLAEAQKCYPFSSVVSLDDESDHSVPWDGGDGDGFTDPREEEAAEGAKP